MGKSSLLNALAGRDAAIVTSVAGTTRDVLREKINLDGMPLHIVDTAGLRDSDDEVEQEEFAAPGRIEQADQILFWWMPARQRSLNWKIFGLSTSAVTLSPSANHCGVK